MTEVSKTADRALAVLLAVSERGPRTARQLSDELGLNRTVLARLINTLHGRGFIVRQDDGYVPGTALLNCAERVQPFLRGNARPFMTRLRDCTGETVLLEIRDGRDASVLDQVISDTHVVRVQHTIGSRYSLIAGAGGRAMLAFLPAVTIGKVPASTSFSAASALHEQLEVVRHQGYAVSRDELQDGVHGVAAPVFDDEERLVAGMAVLVPTSRADHVARHAETVVHAATLLSASLVAADPVIDRDHQR